MVTVMLLVTSGVYADLNNGLVAYYPFDGNVLDASGNGNNGTLYGNAAYTSGLLGSGALHLDGNGSYALIPDSSSLRLSQYTISCWAKLTDVTDPSGCDSLVRKDWSIGKDSYCLYVITPGNSIDPLSPAIQSYASSGNSCAAYGSTPVTVNQWVNIVGTYDGITMKMYLNGNPTGQTSWSGTPAYDNHPIIIGGDQPDGLQWINGDIDDVRIYNRALSQAEISQLVPEPASLSLLAVGGLAMLRRRK